ncbi:MAG: VWA domain-containing protein, partial [Aureliella sp.]
MSQWSFEPVFGWAGVIPLALLMLASLWFTLTAPGIGGLGRAWLVALRLLATSLLLLGWLRPGMVTTVHRDSDSAIAVLVDASQSMTMPSGYGDKSRWSVAHDVWQQIERESQSGFGKTHFVPYLFDSKLHSVSTGSEKDFSTAMTSVWKTPPGGKATDLGTALAELQRTQLDPPLRAAIMLTDGTQTVIPPSADPTLVARQLAQLDQPIVMVGIGPRSEKSQLRDLAIEGVPEHVTAFEKNRVTVPAVVRVRGMQNAPIKIAMTLRSSGQADIPLKTLDILASQADQTLPLNLEVEAPKSGEYLLEIKASVDGNELVTSNNTAFSFMTVRAGGSRILYIEGQPRHEQTFLKRSLNASLDFQVDYLWVQQLARKRWPIDLTKEQNFELYDAFILGDVDARALGRVSLAALRRRVENGAGLLTLGGYHSYDAGGYGTTELKQLADVLPITLSNVPPQSFDGPIDQRFHLPGPVKFVPTIPHPITTLAMEPENAQIWKSLKPLLGANKFGKVKVAPGVQVIAE